MNWTPTGSIAIPSTCSGTRTGSNPGFVDLASKNVRPTSSSPLLNVGTSNPVGTAGYCFPNPLARPAYEPPLHVATAPGSAVARPSVGAIDLGAYELR